MQAKDKMGNLHKIRYHSLIIVTIMMMVVVMGFRTIPHITSVDFSYNTDTILIDSSHIDIKGNTAALAPILAKMQRIKEGQQEILSILHLGDSHVQGGYFTGIVRGHLQRDFTHAGRGFITPLKLMSTNEPNDYEILSTNQWEWAKCSEWQPSMEVGLSGAVISTKDKNIKFSITSTTPFSSITVFHAPDAPYIREDSSLMIGSSCDFESTENATRLYLNSSVTSADIYADIDDPTKSNATFYGFMLHNGSKGILYNEIGINGISYTHINRSPRFMETLTQLESELIIVSLGTNDAHARNFNRNLFRTQAEKTIAEIKYRNPKAIIMLTTPMEFYTNKRPNPNVREVRESLIQIAEKFNLPYWDMYMACGGRGTVERWFKAGMFGNDRIHLTKAGYQLLGDMLYGSIIKLYTNHTLL